MRNSELFASLNFVWVLRSQLKFRSSLFKGLQGSRGQSHLVASAEAKFLKQTAKGIVAITKSVTNQKAQFTKIMGNEIC